MALTGSTATSVATIAVAAVGGLTLAGRAPVKRSARVIVGCFIIFSASLIGQSLVVGAPSTTPEYAPPVEVSPYSPATPAPKAADSLNPFDPYPGASVPDYKSDQLPGIR